MSSFGQELTLDEILNLYDKQSQTDKDFIATRSGENFGPELSLLECLEILRQTEKSNLPNRARWWEIHEAEVQEALSHHENTLQIGGFKFKIEYFAKITSTQKFDFASPMAWMKIGDNGNDPQSGDRDSTTNRTEGDFSV